MLFYQKFYDIRVIRKVCYDLLFPIKIFNFKFHGKEVRSEKHIHTCLITGVALSCMFTIYH